MCAYSNCRWCFFPHPPTHPPSYPTPPTLCCHKTQRTSRMTSPLAEDSSSETCPSPRGDPGTTSVEPDWLPDSRHLGEPKRRQTCASSPPHPLTYAYICVYVCMCICMHVHREGINNLLFSHSDLFRQHRQPSLTSLRLWMQSLKQVEFDYGQIWGDGWLRCWRAYQ